MEGFMSNNTGIKNKTAQTKKKTAPKKQAQPQAKKPTKKMTRAEYDDLRQIEWVPFDPYAD
jgi:hypothetical protein